MPLSLSVVKLMLSLTPLCVSPSVSSATSKAVLSDNRWDTRGMCIFFICLTEARIIQLFIVMFTTEIEFLMWWNRKWYIYFKRSFYFCSLQDLQSFCDKSTTSSAERECYSNFLPNILYFWVATDSFAMPQHGCLTGSFTHIFQCWDVFQRLLVQIMILNLVMRSTIPHWPLKRLKSMIRSGLRTTPRAPDLVS